MDILSRKEKVFEVTFKRGPKTHPLVTHVLATSEDHAIRMMTSRKDVYKVIAIDGKYVSGSEK